MTKDNKNESVSIWNNPDQPYEKALRYGVDTLSNQELLAIVIRNGTKYRNALDLAGEILAMGNQGLRNLCTLTMEDLRSINGIGVVKALELKTIQELGKRLAEMEKREKICLTNPWSIADYFMEQLTYLSEEQVHLCYFNHKMHLLGTECISLGGMTSSVVSIDDIFRRVFRHNAKGFVILHNHPSGNPIPSEDDFRLTHRIHEAAKLLNVSFHDHIIIGDHIYYSFNESGRLTS